jgi:hypothetical protein
VPAVVVGGLAGAVSALERGAGTAAVARRVAARRIVARQLCTIASVMIFHREKCHRLVVRSLRPSTDTGIADELAVI